MLHVESREVSWHDHVVIDMNEDFAPCRAAEGTSFVSANVYDSIGSAPAVNPGGADENSGRSIADRMR